MTWKKLLAVASVCVVGCLIFLIIRDSAAYANRPVARVGNLVHHSLPITAHDERLLIMDQQGEARIIAGRSECVIPKGLNVNITAILPNGEATILLPGATMFPKQLPENSCKPESFVKVSTLSGFQNFVPSM